MIKEDERRNLGEIHCFGGVAGQPEIRANRKLQAVITAASLSNLKIIPI